jgi:hypothetical protein
MVALGQDPLNIKDEQRQCPTFNEFFMNKYLPFVKVDKRSWGTDDSLYRNHIKEVFGDIKMNQITKGKVRDFLHSKVGSGSAKGTAPRSMDGSGVSRGRRLFLRLCRLPRTVVWAGAAGHGPEPLVLQHFQRARPTRRASERPWFACLPLCLYVR